MIPALTPLRPGGYMQRRPTFPSPGVVRIALNARLAALDRHHRRASWGEQRQYQAAENHLLEQVRSGQYARHSLAGLLVRACNAWESDLRWAPDTMELAGRVAMWAQQHDPNDQVVAEYAARRATSDGLLPYVGEAVGAAVTGQYRGGRGVVVKDGARFFDPAVAEAFTKPECRLIADEFAARAQLSFEHPRPINRARFRNHLATLDFTRLPLDCLFAVAEMIFLDLLRHLRRSPNPRLLGIGCGPATCQLLSAVMPVVVQGCNPHLGGQLEQTDFDIVVLNVLDRHLLGEQWDVMHNYSLLPRPHPLSLPSRESWAKYVKAMTLYGCSKLAEGGLLAITAAPEGGTFHIAEETLLHIAGVEPEWSLHPQERRGAWFPQMQRHPLLERFGITQPRGRLLSFWRRA